MDNRYKEFILLFNNIKEKISNEIKNIMLELGIKSLKVNIPILYVDLESMYNLLEIELLDNLIRCKLEDDGIKTNMNFEFLTIEIMLYIYRILLKKGGLK
jgi:hypothetical protein